MSMHPASVYLGGLPNSISRKELFSHLSIYGRINALNLQKGYAFVEFASDNDAADLVNTFSTQPFMGFDGVRVQHARQPRRNSVASGHTSPSPESERSRPRLAPEHARIRYPVIVNNMNPGTCWQELKDFGRLAGGTVAFCDIDKANRRRGFLEYFTQEDADRAVLELSGRDLLGNTVTLSAYGRKKLKVEGQSRSRSRSPAHAHSRLGDYHASMSRSPPPARRRAHMEPYPRSENIRRDIDAPPGYGPRDNGYTSRHANRHVHFSHYEKHDGDPGTMGALSRTTRRGPNVADMGFGYTDDLYVSDERQAKMDQIAMGWESMQSSYAPIRLPPVL